MTSLEHLKINTHKGESEPLPDLGKCSDCGKTYKLSGCPTDVEGDWETGYFNVVICPVCEDGGCIDDYFYSKKQMKKYLKWENNLTGKEEI